MAGQFTFLAVWAWSQAHYARTGVAATTRAKSLSAPHCTTKGAKGLHVLRVTVPLPEATLKLPAGNAPQLSLSVADAAPRPDFAALFNAVTCQRAGRPGV